MIALALVPAVVASYAAQPSSILLRYKFAPGAVHRYGYDMDMKMSMPGQTQGMTTGFDMTITEKVQSVSPDGTATVGVQTQPGTMTMNGKPMNMGVQMGQNGSVRLTPLGEVKSMSFKGVNASGPGGMNPQDLQFGTRLPKNPVHVGSTWTSSMNSAATGAVTFRNHLERIEQRGGSTLAVIHAVGTIDLGAAISKKLGNRGNSSGQMTMNMNYVFNVTTGTLQDMTSEGTYSINMNAPGRNGQSQAMSMKGTQHMRMTLK